MKLLVFKFSQAKKKFKGQEAIYVSSKNPDFDIFHWAYAPSHKFL